MDNYDAVRLVIALVVDIIIILLSINKFILFRKKISTRLISGTALLTAVELVLIVISNYVSIGPVNLNLALVPIAVAGIIFGPLSGLFVGLVNGLVTVLSPSTQAIFMPLSPFGTVFICLLKTGLAGFFSGLVYVPFKNSHSNKMKLGGSFLASALVPLINTGLFTVGCYTFFSNWLFESAASSNYDNNFLFLIMVILGINFIFEFSISILLSPSINMLVNYYSRKVESK